MLKDEIEQIQIERKHELFGDEDKQFDHAVELIDTWLRFIARAKPFNKKSVFSVNNFAFTIHEFDENNQYKINKITHALVTTQISVDQFEALKTYYEREGFNVYYSYDNEGNGRFVINWSTNDNNCTE